MATLTVYAGGTAGIYLSSVGANAYNLGYRYPDNVTWNNVRSAGGTNVGQDENQAYCIYYKRDDADWIGWWYISRAQASFDTSSLGSTAIISAVTVALRGGSASQVSGKSFAANIYTSNMGTTAAASNYQNMGTTALSNTSINFSSWTGVSTTNNFTCNASGIAAVNKTGITSIGVRDATYDAPNTDPNVTGACYGNVSIYSAASPGYLSSITITYTLPVAPTVTGSAATSVATTSMTGNGNITSDGGATVTTRGFCYTTGTSGDPTTANSTAFDTGSFGTGAYTKSITGLTPDTSYRVRAYAINSAGTSYGTTTQEKTLANGPTTLSTWNAITKTSISTIDGVALASVKTWNGVT